MPEHDRRPQASIRPQTAALRTQAVQRVIEEMHRRLDENLTLQDMADVAALSLYHFARVFHQETGMPPAMYLAALRRDEAKRLLQSTSLRVMEVCYQVGYNSVGTFTSRFKQEVGLPPGQFRKTASTRN